MKKLYILALIVIALAQIAAEAQVGPEMRHIKTGEGLVIVSNTPGNYFKMQIKGKEVSRLKTTKKYWYTANGVRFEFYSEENVKFVMTNVPVPLSDDVVLRLYRSDLLRRFADERPKLRTSWLKLANGKRALSIELEKRPADPTPITEKRIYIAIAGAMHTFGLFAPVPAGQNEASVRRVLIRTLGSLILSDEPLEVSK